MKNLNSIATETFKSIFDTIIEEVESKVQESGFDPKSKEGKGLVSILYKKVLSKIGIDLEDYTSAEMQTFFDKHRAEIIKETKDILDEGLNGVSKKAHDNYDSIIRRIEKVEKKNINWDEILDKPEHKDADHKKTTGDIELLFKNIISTRESLKNDFESRIAGFKLRHNELTGIGADDHHAEKHILESHTESKLMTDLLGLVKNPSKGGRYMHGGGASYFTHLLDVPNSYAGQVGNALRVNATATGLEFYTPPKITVSDTAPASPSVNDLWVDIS